MYINQEVFGTWNVPIKNLESKTLKTVTKNASEASYLMIHLRNTWRLYLISTSFVF